jgi:hypothetical protein
MKWVAQLFRIWMSGGGGRYGQKFATFYFFATRLLFLRFHFPHDSINSQKLSFGRHTCSLLCLYLSNSAVTGFAITQSVVDPFTASIISIKVLAHMIWFHPISIFKLKPEPRLNSDMTS